MTKLTHIALAALLMAALPAASFAADDAKPAKEAKAAKEKKEHAGKDHKHHMKVDVPKEAVAVLAPTQGNEVQGVVLMKQMSSGVHLVGKVVNLTPGLHGFHIHQYGDLRAPDGTSAGGHFDPEGHPHGGPDDEKHHVGDLGNIEANEQGVAEFQMKVDGLQLHYVVGRSLVVHAGKDDLKTQPSGDSGPRVAVGVIGYAEVKAKEKDKK